MAYTIDSALDDDLVTVVTRYDNMGVFEIQIGILTTIVTIDLGRFLDSDLTKLTMTHAIKTPGMISPYVSSRAYWDYPAYALDHAVSSLTDEYRIAINDGHTPSEAWLVQRR